MTDYCPRCGGTPMQCEHPFHKEWRTQPDGFYETENQTNQPKENE